MSHQIVYAIRVLFLLLLLLAAGYAFGSEKSWGKTPDYSKPWSPPACQMIAQSIGVISIAREMGATKDGAMSYAERKLEREPNGAEYLGELSIAWDKKIPAQQFFEGCLQKFMDLQTQPPKVGT